MRLKKIDNYLDRHRWEGSALRVILYGIIALSISIITAQ